LLRHESDVLRERVSTLILEVHPSSLGTDKVGKLLDHLEHLGFRKIHSKSDTYVFQKACDLQSGAVGRSGVVTRILGYGLASSLDQQQGAAEVSNC
jgi:hypothetical protein